MTKNPVRTRTNTYKALAANLVESAMAMLSLKNAAMFFLDSKNKDFQMIFSSNDSGSKKTAILSRLDPLVLHIGTSNRLVRRTPTQKNGLTTKFERGAAASLSKNGAEICAPLIVDDSVCGLLMVGPKKHNLPFTNNDLNSLMLLARMGEESLRSILVMEKELNHTFVYSDDMNNDTKSLVTTLQYLQSPLAARQPKEKLTLLLKQAEDVATRLNQSFELNKDRSRLIIDAISGQYQRGSMDIVKVVQLACAKFKILAERKRIHMRISIPGKPSWLEGNSHDLGRVMAALLNNAIRYMESKGSIEVSCGESHGWFQITVKDESKGLDPEQIDRILGMGWRVQNAKEGASGFGLNVARQIVQLHDGQIQFESRGRGKGNVFKVLLPLSNSK